MNQNRKLAKLLFKDNFMFGAVMVHEEICRDFLELAVGFPIEKVKISKEKSMIYHPEYRGIRLDIIARDENRTHYNVEMQVAKKSHLGKRARYYHSQMDMELLLTGEDYRELPAARAGEADSTLDYQDSFIRKIQKSMEDIRSSREMEEKFMLLEELLKDERVEGRAEGRAEGKALGKAESILLLLQDSGMIPDELRSKILEEQDMDILSKYLKLAARAESVAEFMKEMDKI